MPPIYYNKKQAKIDKYFCSNVLHYLMILVFTLLHLNY